MQKPLPQRRTFGPWDASSSIGGADSLFSRGMTRNLYHLSRQYSLESFPNYTGTSIKGGKNSSTIKEAYSRERTVIWSRTTSQTLHTWSTKAGRELDCTPERHLKFLPSSCHGILIIGLLRLRSRCQSSEI